VSKIKEAYAQLMQAIQEETGATPDIRIYLHGAGDSATEVASKLSNGLEVPTPIYTEYDDGAKWFEMATPDRHCSVFVFV
jgi:hypothetical protein